MVSKSDNIITTDSKDHIIHILNTLGECIHYLNTEDQLGIELPFSVAIDNSGILHIGCSTYEGEPGEAKTYMVQIPTF